jgi:HEPN domain-containing protein/predicted nucleotidyltransferase
MTQQESIEKWRRGAQDAIEAAELLQRDGKHALALFHCHLAAEKALKAAYVKEKNSPPPKTHDLLSIALTLSKPWSEAEQRKLNDLTTFAIAARYDDLGWEDDKEATQNVQWWLDTEGLRRARLLKQELLRRGFPVKQLFLFGSVATGKATKDSDVDIAIVCEPFKNSKIRENAEFLWARKDIDLHIETICLHPEDFENKYSTLVHEVKTHGILVD